MWAQLITMRVKPGEEITATAQALRDAQQPGLGLVRSLVMRDQADPPPILTLVVFESEEHARAREQDPRGAEQLQVARSMMTEIVDGPPEFTDLEIVEEWRGLDA